jgi:hypothetical protein
MIQYLPIYAFPFAAFVQFVFTKKVGKYLFFTFTAIALYHSAWVLHGTTYGGYINTVEANDAYFFNLLWHWKAATNQDEYLLDNSENNALVNNPKTVYRNDFETDTSRSVVAFMPISGKKSLEIGPIHQKSADFVLPFNQHAKTLRLSATLYPTSLEWDRYKMPYIAISFLDDSGNEIKYASVCVHRNLNDNEKKRVQITVKTPEQPYQKVIANFCNSTSQTTTLIDDLIIEVGD